MNAISFENLFPKKSTILTILMFSSSFKIVQSKILDEDLVFHLN